MVGSLPPLYVLLSVGLGFLSAILGAVVDPPECDSQKLESLQLKCAENGATSAGCTEDERTELETQSNVCPEGGSLTMTRAASGCIMVNTTGCKTQADQSTPANRCCESERRDSYTKCISHRGSRCACYAKKDKTGEKILYAKWCLQPKPF